ncbi:MAG TPA: bifunctional 23S rRNA (guanine(2069)-N(7))-methyltransferase RlmK/23S rRNA (guanine(2445)-N(2))-methyltransferase RlmL [Steroidobacteraceae bacterium]|nr:bifunctional 23S rRNA (guanine(2069)-N(7))-methyltransferase RlmK/23S rRNA (guanine(2445)-N(2))-methyltransferase RlmL [Steroidobacteraceae bacterium]
MALLSYLASAPRGLADLLARELAALGASALRERPSGVSFQGELALGYRACLHSRVASRVLLEIATFQARTTEEFYRALRGIDWREHVAATGTLACDFSGQHPSIANTHFGTLKLKDAICDQLRETTGARPDIALERPAVRVRAHANQAQISVSIDLAGEGLHRRGWRTEAGDAPLRENVAAGILLRAGWEQMAAEGRQFLDPLCGSGTLVIEAAGIATRRAPGLTRSYFGFLGWQGHDAALWQRVVTDAQANVLPEPPAHLHGSDLDPMVLRMAAANARRAGVAECIRWTHCAVVDARPPAPGPGLVCTNPPYGVRLEDEAGAKRVHRELGRTLREHFAGWEAAILTAAPGAARELNLRTYRTHELDNGAIPCRLLRIDLDQPGVAATPDGLRAAAPELASSNGARMFANRLGKNLKRLAPLAQRAGASCYRVYDADMPEYALALDRYVEAGNGRVHLYVQEYAPPASIDPEAARRRRAEALSVLAEASGVPAENIHLRLRQRQRGSQQYEAQGATGEFVTVAEGGLQFRVNFTDYLDTGLFLDHRLVRARVRELARGKRVLNLYCYTATASVYAADGGAEATTSIDLSNTYLDWAVDNFRLNGLAERRHQLLRAECREWLQAEAGQGRSFDLIYCDPPTFSNSKRMQGVLDVQRDHAALIGECMRLLAPGGRLLFSTNAQRFRLDPGVAERWQVEDRTRSSIPFDFERNPRIHSCFEITAR